jgi:trehalose 6-phosphate synthase
VNATFADAAAQETTAEWAWIHDYQLSLAPAMLREKGFDGRIGFFLHIPFVDCVVAGRYLSAASAEPFRRVIEGMLGADLLGFQTEADVRRFQRAAVALCGASVTDGGLSIDGRSLRTGAFPVGIDVEDVLEVAKTAPVTPRVKAARASRLPVVVGLERGDFTKGIPERLRAVAEAYRQGEKFAYIGIAAPTREGVSAYDSLEGAIEQEARLARVAAASAGGSFAHARANVGWPDVVSLQRDADIVFTSSLSDGQNLVPMQAAIAQSVRSAGRRGVVVTGQDAGVASTYAGFANDGLAVVDPLNPNAMLDTLKLALRGEPGQISERFIEAVRHGDALAWATSFLEALEATTPC